MLVHCREQYPLKYHSDKHDERSCEETKSQYWMQVILVKNKESVQHSEDKRVSSKSCACFLPTLIFCWNWRLYSQSNTRKANIKNFKQLNLSSFRMAIRSFSKHHFDYSENIIWKSNFEFLPSISQLFKVIELAKCIQTILHFNWNQRFRGKRTKFNICHHMPTSSKQLQNRSFHTLWKEREHLEMSKKEKCSCKACKTIVFHNHQICKFVTSLLLSLLWLLSSLIKALLPCLK